MINPFPGVSLLLHGITGGWDELILLAAGVALAVFVVKRTNRAAQTVQSDQDEASPAEASPERQSEQG